MYLSKKHALAPDFFPGIVPYGFTQFHPIIRSLPQHTRSFSATQLLQAQLNCCKRNFRLALPSFCTSLYTNDPPNHRKILHCSTGAGRTNLAALSKSSFRNLQPKSQAPHLSVTMQLSLFALLAATAALVAPVAVEAAPAAHVHMRVHTEKAGACPWGQYYDGNSCRGANRANAECWNPATSKFQTGCAKGFICVNSKCDYVDNGRNIAPCYNQCGAGQFCEKTTNFCRPAKYTNECFNYAIGYFQEGCDAGFECRNSKCEYKQGGAATTAPATGGVTQGKCLNPATGQMIDKCTPGFVCRNGKCDYA